MEDMNQERRTYLGIPLNPESGDRAGPPDLARLATHLGISPGELTAMLEGGDDGAATRDLSGQVTARLSRIAQLVALAEEFLGETAVTWLLNPRASLSTSATAIMPLAFPSRTAGSITCALICSSSDTASAPERLRRSQARSAGRTPARKPAGWPLPRKSTQALPTLLVSNAPGRHHGGLGAPSFAEGRVRLR